MSGWHVTVEENADKAVFLGAPGRFVARVFRGRVHRELALGLRSLEVPSCANQVRPGWTVEMPDWWEQRDNARDRSLVVFRCPNIGETVLEFFTPVAPALERELKKAFGCASSTSEGKEQEHGSEEQQRRSPEALGVVLPLAEAGQPAGEGQRRGHGEGPGEPDRPEGQRLSEQRLPAWKRKIEALARRGRR